MAFFPSRSHGFTLVELMIVIGVISILAVIAYPAYQQQVWKSRRAEAKSALMQLAMVLERVYTENNTYQVKDGANWINPCVQGGCARPVFTNKSPIDGNETFYLLTIGDRDGDGVIDDDYILTAVPQLSGGQVNDQCQTLTLDDLGRKDIAGADPAVTPDYCWR